MHEPRTLTVSEIRQQIYLAPGSPESPKAGNGALLGRLFHRFAAAVLDPDSPAFWQRVLLPSQLDGKLLAHRIYDSIAGPDLNRHHSSLQGSGEQALALWNAVQAYAKWFASLIETAVAKSALRYDSKRECWEGETEIFTGEVPLSFTFENPRWPGSVRVSGRADQLLRTNGRHCVVEFKLGPGSPEADVMQACLYRDMLPGSAPVALLRFLSDGGIEEVLVTEDRVRAARPALLNLIEALAFPNGFPVCETPLRETPLCETPVRDASGGPAKGIEPPRPPTPSAASGDLEKTLISAFRDFGIDVKSAAPRLIGPTFERYFIEAARGVRASAILNSGLNIQMRMRLKSEPIIHLTEGRFAVDIQRADRQMVPFSQIVLDPGAPQSSVLVGVDLAGTPVFADFASAENPHMLVAGTPGSGKSEWLRVAIASLLVRNTPATLRLVVIDPKGNAFPELNQSPFLWSPDSFVAGTDALPVLDSLIEEMTSRYQSFSEAGADHLAAYNGQRTLLPRIVVFCDEFADLLMSGEKKVMESRFIRLGQKSRAAGIHLVLATQRASRQVITANLKGTLPARVVLRVSDRIESGIVEVPGAHHLLGRGDLWFSGGSGETVRLQGPFLDAEDRRRIFGGDGSSGKAMTAAS